MDLVAIDLDGTLLNSAHQISPNNQEIVRQLASEKVTVVIATGRSVVSVKEIVAELGIPAYVLALNGTFIAKIHQGELKILRKSVLDNAILEEALKLAVEQGITFIASNEFGSDRVLFDTEKEVVQEFMTERPDLRNLTEDDMLRAIQDSTTEYLKVAFTDTSVEKLKNLQKILVDQGISTVFSDTHYIEIVPHGINKGASLEYLCKQLMIPLEKTVAIGDQENDIEMLTVSGIGVAMGNAKAHVKAVADLQTNTNDEDGVATILQKLQKDSAFYTSWHTCC